MSYNFYNLNSNFNTLIELRFTILPNVSDPGGYQDGNYIGYTEQSGVQSVWIQFSCGTFQGQLLINNNSNLLKFRCKYIGANWSSITWHEIYGS